MVLGWTEDAWDNEKQVASDDLYWNELSKEQMKAATALGYNDQTWNADYEQPISADDLSSIEEGRNKRR